MKEQVYSPDPKAAAVYAKLYNLYLKLHDSFGGVCPSTDLGGVMKELLAIKDAAQS